MKPAHIKNLIGGILAFVAVVYATFGMYAAWLDKFGTTVISIAIALFVGLLSFVVLISQ